MSYSPKPVFMQPSLRTYWLTDCSHAAAWRRYCEGNCHLCWELNWSEVSSVLTIGCPQHPKIWLGHIQNACRQATHFLPHRPGRMGGSPMSCSVSTRKSGSRLPEYERIWSRICSSRCLFVSEKPSSHQSENPKVTFQMLGTDYLLFIWNTSQRFLCWMSNASENIHSDLLRKVWPKKFW